MMDNSKLTKAQLYGIAGLSLVLIIDLLVPLGVAVGALYLLCFIFVIRETKKTILTFAIIIPILILFKFIKFYSPDLNWMVYANRGISIFVVVIVFLLAIQQRNLLDKTNRERSFHLREIEAASHRLISIEQALNAHLLISITDTNGSIIYVNNNLCDISKYSKSELLGENHRIFKSGEHADDLFKDLWHTISKGNPWNYEIKNRAKDGSFFWCNTIIIPLLDNQKKITQHLALRIPINEKKQLEENQKEHIQSLEKILFDISHKLKSPIATCLGLTQLLEYKRNNTPEALDMAIEHRKTCAGDLAKFSQDIFTYIHEQTSQHKS